jgi:hypothetical protein
MGKPTKKIPLPIELSPQASKLCDVLTHGDEISCALVGASFVDHCLASLIQTHLANSGVTERLLQPSGALGSFGARRMLCYSLKLITKESFQELEIIGDIRNRFAHGFFDISFKDQDIMEFCNKLRAGSQPRGGRPTSRMRYTMAILVLAHTFIMDALAAEESIKTPKNAPEES